MDGFAAAAQGGIEYCLLIQITGRSFRRTDAYRLISHADMLGISVGLGIDGNGSDAKLLAGPHDPARDFPTIGNENFIKQTHSLSQSSKWS
jgi:hypothetical protein